MQNKIAIAVMSFDRPHYLERVLQTVLAQHPFRHYSADFYLFQDGGVSNRTGAQLADPKELERSRKIFTRYLPKGTIADCPHNLGVAMNFDRAERMVYEELDYETCIFLEDDLLLEPSYFQTMEELLLLAKDREDIGMVSARGYKNTSPQMEQHRRANEIRLMDEHNWAFGMHRSAWRARDKVLAPYIEIMSQIDYRVRDKGATKEQLHALQRSLSRHGRGYLTSQDSMKNMAFELIGRHRITTFTNNARYIGKEGLHSTAEKFEARGHHETVVFTGISEGFEIPPSHELRQMRLGLQYR